MSKRFDAVWKGLGNGLGCWRLICRSEHCSTVLGYVYPFPFMDSFRQDKLADIVGDVDGCCIVTDTEYLMIMFANERDITRKDRSWFEYRKDPASESFFIRPPATRRGKYGQPQANRAGRNRRASSDATEHFLSEIEDRQLSQEEMQRAFAQVHHDDNFQSVYGRDQVTLPVRIICPRCGTTNDVDLESDERVLAYLGNREFLVLRVTHPRVRQLLAER